MSENPLAKLDKARAALAECRTLPEIRKISNVAEGARLYAKAAHMSRDTVNYAAEIKLLADRKAGEFLKRLAKEKGGDRKSIGTRGRLICSEYAAALKETKTPDRTARRWQTVAEVPDTVAEKYVAEVKSTDGAEITTKGLLAFASAKDGAAQVSSDSNEYYTLTEHIEAARSVLGAIDLDPASHPAANEVVRAKRFFTMVDDGLAHEWAGNVWLNPPWGSEGPAFVAKLVSCYRDGSISAAILLINAHATDTKWFQPLWDFTLCFTSPRIQYWQPDGVGKSPTSGSVFVYMGPSIEEFTDVFSRYGAVVERRRARTVG